MFCSNCGKEIDDKAVICVNCGAKAVKPKIVACDDGSSFGIALLSFLIPLVGLVLYLINESNRPLRAKSAAKGAIAGVITSIIISVVGTILYFLGITAFILLY